MYVHFSGTAEQSRDQKPQPRSASEALGLAGTASAKLDMVLPKILGMNYANLINDHLQITYDPKHQICSKFLAYFTSRFAIVYNTAKNTQTFY